MILHNNYTPIPVALPEGKPIAIRDLRYNEQFVYDSRSGVYTIHSTDPIKIKRPDGWIVRCGDSSKTVYLIKQKQHEQQSKN